jgi:putative tryptophan/tyrosine transport system substrate-binding protein
MRRRDLLTLLAAASCARPFLAEAEQKPVVIGFLSSASAEGFAPILPSFRDGLKQEGFTEGENLKIEYAWAAGNYDKLPGLASDLVGRKVAVIVATGGAVAALAAKAATSTIPIVFSIGDDPLKFGVVANLGRPGGNITGVTLFMGELAPKRMELLAELAPAGKLAILTNPRNPNAEGEADGARAVAERSGRELLIVKAGNANEIDSAITEIARQPGTAMMVGTDPYFFMQRAQITALAARHAIPAIYFYRDFTAVGGLISYGATITAENRVAGVYAGRILKGEIPGDLPVQQPSKIELLVNAKTARELGITIPSTILALADEIID